ncbi:MAG: pyridoxamine 5'-phosphate oxidase family protein [Deltaproteobacteria bacterium]|nr:pyridoxamine 5'-phosphate oxidase family protein [Deltaproteobacteria bacterium]
MQLEAVKSDLAALFGSQRLAALATGGGGHPYTSLVAFAHSDDLKSLFFVTGRATRKYANLTKDPRVAMLVDNRSNETSDFRESMAVTATGRAGEIQRTEAEELVRAYLAKNPHLEDFLSSPSCALIRIRVERYYLVQRFQNVVEIRVKP